MSVSDLPSSEAVPAQGSAAIGAGLRMPFVLLIVGLYALLVFLPFLGDRTLTRHEAMITEPALNMVNGGHWIVPRFIGEIWVTKPPLLSWVTAGLFEVFGFSEFVARLPAALSAVGLSLLVAVLAGRRGTPLTALFAGLVQATCVYAFMQGRLGEIDFPFALLVAGAHGVLYWHWSAGRHDLPLSGALLFHVLLGLAVLAKGPLAVALVGAGLLMFCWMSGSLVPLQRVVLTVAAPVSILLAGSWYVAAWQIGGEEALARWMYGYARRATGLHHLGTSAPWEYVVAIPWLFLPWTIVLVLGGRTLWTAYRVERRPDERYLWAWFLGGLILLTLMAFKHKHYCIPILPPLSILAGRLLAEHTVMKGRFARDFFVGTFAVIAVVFVVIGGWVMPGRDHRRETVAFVQDAVTRLPDDEPLFLIGLGQTAVFPYIDHPVRYISLRPANWWRQVHIFRAEADLSALRDRLAEAGSEGIWVMTFRKHAKWAEAEAGLVLEELVSERPRRKHPEPDTLVVGRAYLGSAASQPAE